MVSYIVQMDQVYLLSLAMESHASSTLGPYPTNGPSTMGVRLKRTVLYSTMGATGADSC